MSTLSNYCVALAGNPNTGKSTIFNQLTGLKQHTGNWPGKTVLKTEGTYLYQGAFFEVVDLPGTYSLNTSSPEEEVARDFLRSQQAQVTVVVVDATCLERNLNLVLQITALTKNVIVCLNLMDEAKRQRLKFDLPALEEKLNVPIIPTTATSGLGLNLLKDAIYRMVTGQLQTKIQTEREFQSAEILYAQAENIAREVTLTSPHPSATNFTLALDKIVTSRLWGLPLMIALLAIALWLTIFAANYPSELLAQLFFKFEAILTSLFFRLKSPEWLHGLLVLGMYRGVAWVVSVMLPPMAIFFPLFTLLEDFGYLPRIAFNLDNYMQKVGAHGKQALTMAMGLGCNAAGVISARIIDAPRERLIAILTNSLIPCNGRFPILIVMGSIVAGFVFGERYQSLFATFVVLAAILLGVVATLFVAKLLTSTILKGERSYFILELPPYRRPQIKTILVRSFLDRTLFVLWRAVLVALPAGILTWILANINYQGISLVMILAQWLEPLGKLMGLDGVILLGFILGLPANEIVIPIILMIYLAEGALFELDSLAAIQELLLSQGWTVLTAINFILFALFHWPCGTTLLTIKKETGSRRWTILAALIPTVIGIVLCVFLTKIVQLIA